MTRSFFAHTNSSIETLSGLILWLQALMLTLFKFTGTWIQLTRLFSKLLSLMIRVFQGIELLIKFFSQALLFSKIHASLTRSLAPLKSSLFHKIKVIFVLTVAFDFIVPSLFFTLHYPLTFQPLKLTFLFFNLGFKGLMFFIFLLRFQILLEK